LNFAGGGYGAVDRLFYYAEPASKIPGSQILGSKTLGSKTLGSKTLGLKILGSEAPCVLS
jgi:hypothetical protein